MSFYTPQSAYIIASGAYLPGEPVTNDQMETVLGFVNGKQSRYRRRILASNGIENRHYAIDENGESTHLTEEMAANSIELALNKIDARPDTVDMYAVGTTLPDLLAPGIASQVHGRIGGKQADILSCAGICGAGAAALKAASMSVISGQHQRVAACGTERPSVIMRGGRFDNESQVKRDKNNDAISESYQYFNADFLRWMLSDGAGAFIIDNAPNSTGLSLKIEWIETASYANDLPVCMYMGSSKPEEMDTRNTWLEQGDIAQAEASGMLLLRQDSKLLVENIVNIVCDFALKLKNKGFIDTEEVDYFVPHISSFFFKEKLAERLAELDLAMPMEKWFTNLKDKGNTGAASIYIMLDELFDQKYLANGQKVLLMIPESGRFSVTYALLSVVEN